MKKFKIFTTLLIVLTMAVAAIACNEPTLESISFKQGTVATSVEQGGTLDTSDAVIIAHYSDGSTKEISVSDSALTIKIGSFSTAEAGKFKLTASYKGLTCDMEVTVTIKGATLQSISVKPGTIATSVEQGKALDTSKAVIIAHYSDGSENEITVSDPDLKIGAFSTAEVGKFDLHISYKDKECNVNIEVTAKDEYASYEIVEVNMPEFVADYRNAIAEKPEESKRTEFYVRDDGYYVGDDNEFKFMPSVLVEKDGFDIETDYSLLDAQITVEVKGDDYQQVNAEEYVNTVAYGSYKFNEIAVGKQIRFTVKPFIKNHPDSGSESVSFEFKVIDGWNAYTATDLAMIEADRLELEDNVQNKESAKGWEEFKKAHGLPLDHKASAVIMHNNINITKDDIPSVFFFNENEVSPTDSDYERAVGSLKDSREIYQHNVLPGEHFELIGNYFTMNAGALPLVVRERHPGTIKEPGTVISHATLIKFRGKNKDIKDDTPRGSAVIKNIYLVGNSNRSDENNGILSGGLINHKMRDVDASVENCISVKWFITYFPERTYGDVTEYDINQCKSYDNYNSFVYIWGGGDYTQNKFFTIRNSEMIGAGGPVMILDHCNSQREDGGYPTNVKVTNCKLESVVSGQEGWFTLVGATALVNPIKGMDQIFNAYQRKFLKDGKFNFIAVFKANNDGDSLISSAPIKGYLQIDDNAPLDFGQGTPAVLAHLSNLKKKGVPIFQSSTGGVGYFDGKILKNIAAGNVAVKPDDPLFSGDYLNIYIGNTQGDGFLGAMFEYYPM